MATTNSRDKFIELRKSGVDPVKAREQAYGSIASTAVSNTPIAGQPPAITPEPIDSVSPTAIPVNVNEQQRIDNQTKRQDMIAQGEVPAVGQTPPPTQITPAPTPEAQTEITPTPVSTPTPLVDKTAEIKAKNEGQLAINKQQADQRQAERDKATQDANNQLANSETAILNTLRTGGIVPEVVKTSSFYKSAQQTFNKLQQYSTYSTADLTTALNNGALLPGTSVYNEMLKAPAMKQKLTTAQIYTVGQPVNINQVYTAVSNEILSNNPTTASFLDDGVITPQEYASETNNGEIVAKAKDVEAKTNKYNTLKAEYDSIEDEVKAQFPGSPFADSIIADRQKAKYKNLIFAKGEVDSAVGTLTELKSQSANLFETNLKLYESRRAEYSAIAKEQRDMQAQKDLMQYKVDFDRQQAEQTMNDPNQAIPAMIEEYKKLGIPFTRSTQQVISDFQASGQDLPTFLSGLQKTIQSKPEYQRYQAIQQGQLSEMEKFTMQNQVENQKDVRNFAQQKELAILNKDLTREQFLYELENDPTKRLATYELENKINANKSLFDILGKNVGTYEGNRGYDLAGTIGDPLPAGGTWTVKSIEQAGEMGIPFIAGSKKPYGNTVVMTDEEGNQIRYSHLEKIGVKPGDTLGFGDIIGTRGNTGNVKGANGETLTAEQLKKGRGAHLDIEIKDAKGRLLSQSEQIEWLKTKKAGSGDTTLTDKQFTQYNQMLGKFNGDPSVKAFESALAGGGDLIASLNSENGPGDVGAVFGFMKSLDPASVVKEGEFALAAKSAGVWESFKNIPANKLEGTILTEKQRKDFGKLAFSYIKSKGKLYDIKYNDLTKVLEKQGVGKTYYPTKMTDMISSYENEATPEVKTTTSSGINGSNNRDYTSLFN